MGCAQSKEGQGSTTRAVPAVTPKIPPHQNQIQGIGRTERIIHRGRKQNNISRPSNHSGVSNTTSESSSKDSKFELQNQLKQSIRDRNKSALKGPDLDPITGNLVPSEVINRRDKPRKVDTTKVLNGTVTIDYAYCTQRGYYPDGK